MKYQDFLTKSKIKLTGSIINAPKEIETEFIQIGYSNTFPEEKSNLTLVFIENAAALAQIVPTAITKIENDSLLWICYPKGSSKVKTDINRDILWKLMETYQLRPVTLLSFDNIWSAMRFRPIDKVKSSK